ncbi:MAG TPA: D-lyxose/D-mannose family sugar isomerase [Terriglobia bacterium]|jgi:D-lyxose ketol-isomerase|nr:D-lyxose/D-mannose family sugar isomerase [Terriglobia bacterium]
MLTREQFNAARQRTLEMFQKAGIRVTPEEEERIEVADFGLGDLERIGLEILTYVNTERVCAKELAMFPGQTCPEHRHPPVAGEPGKEETFRCRWGEVYLYVPGEAAKQPKAKIYPEHGKHLTVWHEVVLRPGEQYTLRPNTLHWFQAGPDGAIVSEFSTRSRDESDVFTDPRIEREPKVEGK